MKQEEFYEEQFFKYFDQIKILFFPDKWNTNLLDYSKNEFLTIIFIYRHKKVTTSEIAKYLMSPLNTVTGVVNRLEKKGIIERIRDVNDKRVVNISLTDKGISEYNQGKELIIYYFKKIYKELSEEERNTMFDIAGKVIKVLSEERHDEKTSPTKKKRIRKITIE